MSKRKFSQSSSFSFFNPRDPSLFTLKGLNHQIKRHFQELQAQKNNELLGRDFSNTSIKGINDFDLNQRIRPSKSLLYATNQSMSSSISLDISQSHKKTKHGKSCSVQLINKNDDYDKIFQKIFKEEKKTNFNNIYNIYYAENQEHFLNNLNRTNDILRRQGKEVNEHPFNQKDMKDKITNMKNKISFIQNINNYAYPGIVIHKISQISKVLNEKKIEREGKFMLPCVREEIKYKARNRNNEKLLEQSISIINKSQCIRSEKPKVFKRFKIIRSFLNGKPSIGL